MTSKTIVKITAIFLAFVFIATFNMPNSTAHGQKCENTPETNEAIVNSIYEKINGNKDLAPQLSHINITSTNLAIKIQGWTDSKKDYDKVVSYALETECALKLNVNDFHEVKPANLMPGPGCSNGTKECGDICIPNNDICNIKGE